MSVAILIEFKDPGRDDLYIPLATEGAYSNEWLPMAKRIELHWLPIFHSGARVGVEDLPAVMDEFRRLRSALAEDPRKSSVVERLDFVLKRLHEVDNREIAGLFIG
jgi:hypothetical protein